MKVEAILEDGSTIDAGTNSMDVAAHDRSGFAFSSESDYKTGSGAYNKEDSYFTNAVYVGPNGTPTGNGEKENPLDLISAIEAVKSLDESAILLIDGSYWYLEGMTIYGAAGNGIMVSGSHNIIENCVLDSNIPCYIIARSGTA